METRDIPKERVPLPLFFLKSLINCSGLGEMVFLFQRDQRGELAF